MRSGMTPLALPRRRPVLVGRRHVDLLRTSSALCRRPPLTLPRARPEERARKKPHRSGHQMTTSWDPLMPPATQRAQGQWALDQRAPLNAAEQVKQDDDGLNVRERIITRYAREGFDAIEPEDLRQRFKWWGLYTQRAPGIDGGRTGSLADAEIEDRYFMMRVRIPGGQLTAEQLRAVASRHPVRPRRRRRHGPAERPVPLDPDRGRARDLGAARGRRPVDHDDLRRRPAQHPRVPRRRDRRPTSSSTPPPSLRATDAFAAATARSPTCRASARPRSARAPSTDIAARDQRHLVRRRRAPRAGPGFDLWVGGGLSTNPMLAQRLGAFVAPERGARGVGRRRGDLPRLRLPPAAQPGPAEVPRRRLGSRAVPRGAGGRVPRRRPARRARAAAAATEPARPRRRAHPADGRVLRRRRAGRRAGLRRPKLREARRPRRGVRVGPGAHDGRAEARRARRPAARVESPRSPSSRPATCRPSRRCSAAARSPAPASSSASSPSSRPRPAAAAAVGELERRLPDFDTARITIRRQRLPQLVRPYPDRRHRAQGARIVRRRRE